MLALKVMQYVIICQYLISYTLLAPSTQQTKATDHNPTMPPKQRCAKWGMKADKQKFRDLIDQKKINPHKLDPATIDKIGKRYWPERPQKKVFRQRVEDRTGTESRSRSTKEESQR
jgi:hypothetical protein